MGMDAHLMVCGLTWMHGCMDGYGLDAYGCICVCGCMYLYGCMAVHGRIGIHAYGFLLI